MYLITAARALGQVFKSRNIQSDLPILERNWTKTAAVDRKQEFRFPGT